MILSWRFVLLCLVYLGISLAPVVVFAVLSICAMYKICKSEVKL